MDDFREQFLAALRDAPPMATTERVTPDGGLEIQFHTDDPQRAGGGTLVIPPELLRP